MTVAENLGFGLKLRGHIAGRDRAARARGGAGAGAGAAAGRRARRAMSGGQHQRVALGRALVRNPKVFLLDEPLSNLDAKLRLSMRVEIARLHRQLGASMIYVTHDQIEAMTLGQRIVVLDGGVIQQIDTPMNLYRPAGQPVRGRLPRQPGDELAARHAEPSTTAGGWPPRTATSCWPARAGGGVAAWRDRAVVLGIRPEDLQPAERGAAAFSARLEVIEPVGNEVFLNLRQGDRALVSRVSPRSLPSLGDAWRWGWRPSACTCSIPPAARASTRRGRSGQARRAAMLHLALSSRTVAIHPWPASSLSPTRKAASARPPLPSISPLRWPPRSAGYCWSTWIRRATPRWHRASTSAMISRAAAKCCWRKWRSPRRSCPPTGHYDLLPGNGDLTAAELKLMDALAREHRLKEVLRQDLGQLRHHPDRLPAVAESADPQCADRRRWRADSGAVRVFRAGRAVQPAGYGQGRASSAQSRSWRSRACCAPCTTCATTSATRFPPS